MKATVVFPAPLMTTITELGSFIAFIFIGFIAGEKAAADRALPAIGAARPVAVLFLTFLDNTIVSVALGSVQSDLHAGVTALQWVVSAYALTFVAAMLGFVALGLPHPAS